MLDQILGEGPASSKRTLFVGCSDNRFARAAPAEPAPTMTKS